MRTNRFTIRSIAPMFVGILLIASLLSCQSLPGTAEEQGAVAGGAAGAIAGATLAENSLIGALIGGALGAGGGYLIGSRTGYFDDNAEDVRQEAQDAVQEARTDPATAEEALAADSADINNDGFVTMDELIAMEDAGLPDDTMIERLQATDQVFDLSDSQEKYLLDEGVSRYVVNELPDINRQERDRVLQTRRPDKDQIISEG